MHHPTWILLLLIPLSVIAAYLQRLIKRPLSTETKQRLNQMAENVLDCLDRIHHGNTRAIAEYLGLSPDDPDLNTALQLMRRRRIIYAMSVRDDNQWHRSPDAPPT
ncbi:MAG TPA: hypothetical protein VGH44_04345 [Candidatus Saccharimonadia bacterium]|jgi:hypothetical protein